MRRSPAGSVSIPVAGTALFLIDVINDLDFNDSGVLVAQAQPMAVRLSVLKRRATAEGVPCVYVNDNFGQWRSDFRQTVAHCTSRSSPGRRVSRRLRPTKKDYFVLKPKHSGFFSTTLDTLLEYLRASTLILTGLTADNCVLFTASDAYLRDFQLVVPPDCVASIEREHTQQALEHMRRVLKAELTPSTALELSRAA